jgi:hypothetical protein
MASYSTPAVADDEDNQATEDRAENYEGDPAARER